MIATCRIRLLRPAGKKVSHEKRANNLPAAATEMAQPRFCRTSPNLWTLAHDLRQTQAYTTPHTKQCCVFSRVSPHTIQSAEAGSVNLHATRVMQVVVDAGRRGRGVSLTGDKCSGRRSDGKFSYEIDQLFHHLLDGAAAVDSELGEPKLFDDTAVHLLQQGLITLKQAAWLRPGSSYRIGSRRCSGRRSGEPPGHGLTSKRTRA